MIPFYRKNLTLSEPAMLGLELLYFLRRNRGRRLKQVIHPLEILLRQLHQYYRNMPVGVFSIYTERYWQELQNLLGLSHMQAQRWLIQKQAGMPRTRLLRLIQDLAQARMS